jgi:hypothetical protein
MQANGATGALRTVISYTAGVEPPPEPVNESETPGARVY